MAEINISVIMELLGRVNAFDPDIKNLPQRLEKGKKAGSPYYANDLLGREVFLPITFTYTDSQATGGVGSAKNGKSIADFSEDSVDISKQLVLHYAVIAISCKHKFVKTELTERVGPVIQAVYTGAYEILITGVFVSQTNDMPEDEITVLQELFAKRKPIKIANPLTDIFLTTPDRGTNVIIEALRTPPTPGVKHVRKYELELSSVAPFNLIDIS